MEFYLVGYVLAMLILMPSFVKVYKIKSMLGNDEQIISYLIALLVTAMLSWVIIVGSIMAVCFTILFSLLGE